MASSAGPSPPPEPAPDRQLNENGVAKLQTDDAASATEQFPPFDPPLPPQDDGPALSAAATDGRPQQQRPVIPSTTLSSAPEPDIPPALERVTSPVTSPPYWSFPQGGNGQQASHRSHQRSVSTDSLLPPGAITLRDNERDDDDAGRGRGNGGGAAATGRDKNKACWAKSVEVTDYVVVNGSATNVGAFVVYNIKVETLSGSYMNIRKRYSEFDEFRRRLVHSFPGFEAAVPELPPKSVISKFRPRFLEKRRAGLQYFLNCILLNPEFSGSPVLKEFLFN
ncbi:PX domain-containing protein [Pleurostoma richardsiae]|uniref:Endosomal/vacuolar adapter protein YPT35 n=1 Tax=Pleurostoma richardsiae TaxID=41990 RepID=A0AA38RPH9_9PEZI|nr:PX domain-containing protein [Pleurostoma richardsiae]